MMLTIHMLYHHYFSFKFIHQNKTLQSRHQNVIIQAAISTIFPSNFVTFPSITKDVVKMKANIWLLGAILASSTLVTTAHADNATRVAATSALGSVVGTAIGKEIGGNNGAMIGSALGGAGGAAAASGKNTRTEAAIGGGLGGVGGYTVGKNVGGTTGGYIGAAAGAAGGAALGRKVGQDRDYDNYQSKKYKKKRKHRHH